MITRIDCDGCIYDGNCEFREEYDDVLTELKRTYYSTHGYIKSLKSANIDISMRCTKSEYNYE